MQCRRSEDIYSALVVPYSISLSTESAVQLN